jgi:hypothetical protein
VRRGLKKKEPEEFIFCCTCTRGSAANFEKS